MRVFVAAPFTAKVEAGPDGPQLETAFSNLIASALAAIRTQGIEAFSAHEREKWGAEIYEPVRALREDLGELHRCDLILAIIGDPPSPGVQMELGYALALGKPIACFFNQPFENLPHLVKGFKKMPGASLIAYQTDAELVSILKDGAQAAFYPWMEVQKSVNHLALNY